MYSSDGQDAVTQLNVGQVVDFIGNQRTIPPLKVNERQSEGIETIRNQNFWSSHWIVNYAACRILHGDGQGIKRSVFLPEHSKIKGVNCQLTYVSRSSKKVSNEEPAVNKR